MGKVLGDQRFINSLELTTVLPSKIRLMFEDVRVLKL